MARKITVTRAELEALRVAFTHAEVPFPTVARSLGSLLKKAEAAHAPEPEHHADEEPTGISVAAAEAAFLGAAGQSGAKMGRLSTKDAVLLTRALKERGCTTEQLAQVGRWLKVQRWFRGHATLQQVLNQWANWSGRAAVELRGPVTRAPAPLSSFQDVPMEDFTEVNRGGGTR